MPKIDPFLLCDIFVLYKRLLYETGSDSLIACTAILSDFSLRYLIGFAE